MILLDTHILIWSRFGGGPIGALTRHLIEQADGEIGIRANELPDFHPDPADRIIVATAMNGHQLVTADRRILDWSGNLRRLDAAR